MYFSFVDYVKMVIILSSQIDNGLYQKEKNCGRTNFGKTLGRPFLIILILVGEFLQSAVPVKLVLFLSS